MKYIFPLVFLFVYIGNINAGYSGTSATYTHFIYMFQHANLLHLTLNTLSLLTFWGILEKVIPVWRLSGYTYMAALTASFTSVMQAPTVGASGMVYALVGIYIILTLSGKKIKINDKKKYVFWLIILLASSVVGAFNPHINNLNHLTAFVIGVIFGIIENRIER